MKMKNETTKNILNYLYKLEFFSPAEPRGNIVYESNKKQEYKLTEYFSRHKETTAVFTFYFGIFKYQKSLDEITKLAKIKEEYQEKGKNESTIVGFKVDEEGNFLESTFSICNFVYAINEILKMQDIEIDLKEEKIREITNQIKELSQINKIVLTNPKPYLDKLFLTLKEVFSFIADNIIYDLKITVDYLSKKNIEELEGASILSSFYLSDLANLKDNFNNKIVKYLSLEPDKRIAIDVDTIEIDKIISPENAPLAKWPSIYDSSLMQQVAINLSINGNLNIFSVNGPPGSGKTTLVKEIIAGLIASRAEIISNYNTPDEAFIKEDFIIPEQYYKSYYKLDPKLSAFGILVASNNNNAVENISLELPKAEDLKKEKTLTGLFDSTNNKEIYFTDLMQNIIPDSWGLISAPLGNSKNIKKYLNAIWFSEDTPTLRDYFKDTNMSFYESKKRFKQKLEEVKEYRKYLIEVRNKVKMLEQIEKEIENQEENLEASKNRLTELEKEKDNLENSIQKLLEENKSYFNLIQEVNSKLPFIIRLLPFFFRNNAFLKKRKEYQNRVTTNDLKILEIKESTLEINLKIENQQELINELTNIVQNLKQEKDQIIIKVNNYKKEGIIIADKDFYQDIRNNQKSQEKNPWTSQKYNILREELFYESLQLHKSFILNSSAFKTNMGLLVNALKGSLENENHKKCFKELLNTLFLFTPVISTSLASVSKLLHHIEADEIGYLIIDEAGQATPASTVGVINRAKNSIILGDPLQVEPVATIPRVLYHILDKDLLVPNLYHSSVLSSQILADTINKYGGKRGVHEEEWIGSPLLLHRRCINPMFEIANEIAYENKMFYRSIDKSDKETLSIKKSCWIDIKGKEIGNKNHYVKEQGEKVLEFVKEMIKVNGGLTKFFIISPFKTVAYELQKKLNKELPKIVHEDTEKIREWVANNCGTIHTFQGKEANEVLIVLGCDESSEKAAAWAGQKPNILNVAITRAKYRVVIIGDSNIWGKIDYFNVAYKNLQ